LPGLERIEFAWCALPGLAHGAECMACPHAGSARRYHYGPRPCPHQTVLRAHHRFCVGTDLPRRRGHPQRSIKRRPHPTYPTNKRPYDAASGSNRRHRPNRER
jgi:hypothetical protein